MSEFLRRFKRHFSVIVWIFVGRLARSGSGWHWQCGLFLALSARFSVFCLWLPSSVCWGFSAAFSGPISAAVSCLFWLPRSGCGLSDDSLCFSGVSLPFWLLRSFSVGSLSRRASLGLCPGLWQPLAVLQKSAGRGVCSLGPLWVCLSGLLGALCLSLLCLGLPLWLSGAVSLPPGFSSCAVCLGLRWASAVSRCVSPSACALGGGSAVSAGGSGALFAAGFVLRSALGWEFPGCRTPVGGGGGFCLSFFADLRGTFR